MKKVAFTNKERGVALSLCLPAGCQLNAFHLGVGLVRGSLALIR